MERPAVGLGVRTVTSTPIYTRTGDDGTTGLLFGGRTSKADPLAEQPQRRRAFDDDQRLAPGAAPDLPLRKARQLPTRPLHAPGTRAPLPGSFPKGALDSQLAQRADDHVACELVPGAGSLQACLWLRPAEAKAARVQRGRAPACQAPYDSRASLTRQRRQLDGAPVADVKPPQ
jgi:hypothetical protein